MNIWVISIILEFVYKKAGLTFDDECTGQWHGHFHHTWAQGNFWLGRNMPCEENIQTTVPRATKSLQYYIYSNLYPTCVDDDLFHDLWFIKCTGIHLFLYSNILNLKLDLIQVGC